MDPSAVDGAVRVKTCNAWLHELAVRPVRLGRISTFVLVHGAWQSTGTWDLLTPLLEEHGHTVITPVLSGLGTDQSRLSPEITLQRHIEDVSQELSRLPPVILVGHSYAGMIISGVAENNPARVQRLVFLDAFIPEDGQSVLDLLPPEIGVHFRDIAREQGAGWRLPGGESQLDLWGLEPGEARDFVRARLCDFSLRCFEGPLTLPANRKSNIPATFVACVAQRYPAREFFKPFAEKARASAWEVVELKTGHDCHVERPSEIAMLLLAADQSR
ncbi:MAG: alpha/beta hydrolase [Acidobacteriales bacterium]|nr:alpha/beta hydrolase [Terriglobales bacterium]